MRIDELRKDTNRRRYSGPPLEAGGTSIPGKEAPAIRWLESQGSFQGAKTVLDYGAGKFDRNSNYLRNKGFNVYSFDPINGDPAADGWISVTKRAPRSNFDVSFSSFVLNVVPEYIERDIVRKAGKRAKSSYHIVRDDITKPTKAALARKDPLVTNFFLKEFATPQEAKLLEAGQLPDEVVIEFCEHGTVTRAGFQRNVTAEDYGLKVINHKKGSYKIYQA